MRALLVVVTLLATTVTPASAGWIMYENQKGAWRGVSSMYQDLKACEADAKALSEKNQTWTGCAVPPPVAMGGTGGGAQTPAAKGNFELDASICARRAGVKHFTTPGERVSYRASEARNFAFEKCMASMGSPLEEKMK